MRNIQAIIRRELAGYFTTPVAYVFLVVFLAMAGALTFYVGNFYERGQADLQSFFSFHPWLYLFLIPAISMRLWAEERKSGTIELLLTLPITVGQAVLGKFVAAWIFTGIALALTFPVWITVNVLGSPDNGVIVASYLGSFFMAGAYLAIGACFSALTRNQVIAFVLSASVCFLFTVSGTPLVLDFFQAWLPAWALNTVAGFSFLSHFETIAHGVVDLRDLVFFASLMAFFLFVNAVLVDLKKGE